MRKYLSLFWLTIIVLLTAATANAAPQVLTATLTGAQENPATGSAGTGSALVTLDTVANTITISVSFSGLTGTTTASHIHCCAPVGVNAGVATTTPFFPGFPIGVNSGTYLQTFNLNLASTYNPAFVTANGGTVAGARAVLVAGLLGGQTYLNIHTNVNPGGEIRGQLVADTTAPSITCPGSLTKFTDSGQSTATVNPGTPVATDNVAVQSVTGVRSDGKPLNAPYPIGVTTINWTATDTSGNTASCGQSIGVMAPSGQRRRP